MLTLFVILILPMGFLTENNYRLEGMYVLAPLFDVNSNDGWYKITNVRINRNHLLATNIDNIELLLKNQLG